MMWIEVTDRLPFDNEHVLVYDNISERIGVREHLGGTFYSIDSDGEDGMAQDNIEHWMPLPEPPK